MRSFRRARGRSENRFPYRYFLAINSLIRLLGSISRDSDKTERELSLRVVAWWSKQSFALKLVFTDGLDLEFSSSIEYLNAGTFRSSIFTSPLTSVVVHAELVGLVLGHVIIDVYDIVSFSTPGALESSRRSDSLVA